MRCVKRIAALAGISLAACGGGSPSGPTPEQLAVAAAIKTLEPQKTIITNAYRNMAFPSTANSPISTVPPDAKYVASIAYNSSNRLNASVLVTIVNTGNPILDGRFLGMFATGQFNGTVTWHCGTANAVTDTVPMAVTALYPYLPEYCQN
jgi:hypothetical protein